MRSSDCDILIVPGLGNSGPDHWQTRWEARLSTARRVEQMDWERASRDLWVERLLAGVALTTRPVVLVAHSLGVSTVAHAAGRLDGTTVRGAFLVAPPGAAAMLTHPGVDQTFAQTPREPLPFPSVLVASATDPFCALEEAEDLAAAWGSAFVPAGEAGHLNVESGHGPWPEGSMRFAMFLKSLG